MDVRACQSSRTFSISAATVPRPTCKSRTTTIPCSVAKSMYVVKVSVSVSRMYVPSDPGTRWATVAITSNAGITGREGSAAA